MRIIVTLYGTTAGAADVLYFTHQSGEGKTLDHQATVVQEILSRASVEKACELARRPVGA